MLQEGKLFNGIGMHRGYYPMQVFEEIHQAGGGVTRMLTSLDGFVAKTMAYTTCRIWGFLYFYDWLNPDPRRTARMDWMAMAGLAGGLVAGVAINPIDMVFTRMQADDMYPEAYKRNYRGIIDGLVKVADEGVLFRGALANGLRIGMLASTMTGTYDWCKENSYFFLGPSWINRLWATAAATIVGCAASLPFDAVRTRMHTMRPLPNGRMPYSHSLDCFAKMMKYEASNTYCSNFGGAFYAGMQAYMFRMFALCYGAQFVLDYYHAGSYVSEFWQPARYNYQSGLDYDIHDPYTDSFNKWMVTQFQQDSEELPEFMPEGKGQINYV